MADRITDWLLQMRGDCHDVQEDRNFQSSDHSCDAHDIPQHCVPFDARVREKKRKRCSQDGQYLHMANFDDPVDVTGLGRERGATVRDSALGLTMSHQSTFLPPDRSDTPSHSVNDTSVLSTTPTKSRNSSPSKRKFHLQLLKPAIQFEENPELTAFDEIPLSKELLSSVQAVQQNIPANLRVSQLGLKSTQLEINETDLYLGVCGFPP